MRYSALAPGKRLRPALCMAAAEAVGASANEVLDAACAIEMVHAFSLIHDDLPAIDNDDLRRGRPTCHIEYGEAVAILAGDALFALAFRTVHTGPWTPEQRNSAGASLSLAALQLVDGETEDILSEGVVVDAETLTFIHRNKTGALIAASAEIGAILGGGNAEQVQALRQYGEHIGLAFQIADDVLNETSTPEQLGKAVGSDRERGKATYPSLYGLETARKAAVDAAEVGIQALSPLGTRATLLRDLARFSVDRLA